MCLCLFATINVVLLGQFSMKPFCQGLGTPSNSGLSPYPEELIEVQFDFDSFGQFISLKCDPCCITGTGMIVQAARHSRDRGCTPLVPKSVICIPFNFMCGT